MMMPHTEMLYIATAAAGAGGAVSDTLRSL